MDSETETRKETVKRLLVSVPDYIQKVQCDTNQRTAPFKCAVRSCPNFFLNFEGRDKLTYKFHNFPLDENLCATWKQRCSLIQETDISKLKVCSDHFSLDDYIRNYKEEFLKPEFKRKLKPHAVPQNNLGDSASNDLLLSEMKEIVDENGKLRNKYEDLLNAKRDITNKIAVFKKKISCKIRDLKKVQDALKKDRAKNEYISKYGKNVVRKVFSAAQVKLLLGRNRVVWSDDDLAKAFTLRHMGGKECYLYLKNTLNLPLPALSCVQKWAASCSSH